MTVVTRALRLSKDQRIRFLVIGAINSIVGYGLFASLQWSVGGYISYFGSLIGAHVLASFLAFTLYRAYVFRVRGNVVLDFLRFQTIYLIPLTANLIALPFLVTYLQWNVYLSQAMIVAISAVTSYLGHKFFSFRRGSRGSNGKWPGRRGPTIDAMDVGSRGD